MHRFCMCGHKEKAHNEYGICAVCECDYFKSRRAGKFKFGLVKYPRRTPAASRRIMGHTSSGVGSLLPALKHRVSATGKRKVA
jgi:hypothetical protein